MTFKTADQLIADGIRSPGTIMGGLVLEPISNDALAKAATQASYEIDGARYLALPEGNTWAVYDQQAKGYRPMCHTDQDTAKRIARALQWYHDHGPTE